MKTAKHIFFSAITTLYIATFLNGCEKVIELKTNDVPAKYVIEANMSDVPGDCVVFLSMSAKLNDPTIFPGISGATITISDNGGAPVQLFESSHGVYQSSVLRSEEGHTYTLDVEIAGKHFTSVNTGPAKVDFDSVYVADFQAFGEVRKFAHVIFRDPPGKGNSYRFLQYKNGVQNSNIFIMDDEYSDGKEINTFLAYFDQSDDQRIDIGDTITVQMQTIDPAIYKFFYSLSQGSTGGNEVVAPGNPVTNIVGGALGYFNVYTKQEKTVIVK